jgi:hypothetical protein
LAGRQIELAPNRITAKVVIVECIEGTHCLTVEESFYKADIR